jgi:hypothetical protein
MEGVGKSVDDPAETESAAVVLICESIEPCNRLDALARAAVSDMHGGRHPKESWAAHDKALTGSDADTSKPSTAPPVYLK